jgi:hypothetical protein
VSGGSYDYAYRRVLDFADDIDIDTAGDYEDGRSSPAQRAAFREHLRKVAAAMKAIEWNDSGDGADDEGDLIRACLDARAIAEGEE